MAPYIYHQQHDKWPESFAEVISDGLLPKEQLHSYLQSADLPDRRDIKKMKIFEDWLYIKPVDGAPATPMILAPRPFTSSMGKALPKSRRVMVDSETRAKIVDDDTLMPILRHRTGN